MARLLLDVAVSWESLAADAHPQVAASLMAAVKVLRGGGTPRLRALLEHQTEDPQERARLLGLVCGTLRDLLMDCAVSPLASTELANGLCAELTRCELEAYDAEIGCLIGSHPSLPSRLAWMERRLETV